MTPQCLGTTRSGERCKITRNLIDGYCHLHRKQQLPGTPPTPPVEEKSIPSPEPERTPPSTEPPSYLQEDHSDMKSFLIIVGILFLIMMILLNLSKRKKSA